MAHYWYVHFSMCKTSFPVSNIVWSEENPIMVQIGEILRDLGDRFGETMWGYFKEFQIRMHKRERIPTSIVKKFKENIFFLVDTDCCIIQAVQPKTFWIPPMVMRS